MRMTFCPFIPQDAREGLGEILIGVAKAVDEFPAALPCSKMAQYADVEWLFRQTSVQLDIIERYASYAFAAWMALFDVPEAEAQASDNPEVEELGIGGDFYAFSFFLLERNHLYDLHSESDAESRLCFSRDERSLVMELIWGVVKLLDGTELGESLASADPDGRITLDVLVPREMARMVLNSMRRDVPERAKALVALLGGEEGVLDYAFNWFRLEREVMEQDAAMIGKLFRRLVSPSRRA